MRLLALGVDYRSAPASIREALAFDGTKLDAGLDLVTRTFRRHRVRDSFHLQPGGALRRQRPRSGG